MVYYLPYPNNNTAPSVIIKNEWFDNIGTNKCPIIGTILCTNPLNIGEVEYISYNDMFIQLLKYIELFIDSEEFINGHYSYYKNILLHCFDYINTYYLETYINIVDLDYFKILWSICYKTYTLFIPYQLENNNSNITDIILFSKYMMISINYKLNIPINGNPNNVIEINTLDFIKLFIETRRKEIVEPLNKLTEIIENNTDNISEGDYIKIMDILKNIYDI